MAVQRKKQNRKVITITKTTKKNRTKKKNKVDKIFAFKIILLILLSVILSIGTFYLFFHDKKVEVVPQENKTVEKHTNKTQKEKIVAPLINTKPKLVIIIDDMAFPYQAYQVAQIPLKLSPSFLPPSKNAPDSPKLAKHFPFYMVHLPLEAINFNSAELQTLSSNDSYEKILEMLTRLQKQFPNALYYNNHTGSKFTADHEALEKLFHAMKELGIIFVDSRTTAQTKAPELAQSLGENLFQRDVFLDHVIEKNAIREQLNLAIEKAKENGFAIVIGHPHKETLEVINESVSLINSKVEVIYLNELKIAKN